jgi:hypothetical protein
MGFLSELGVTLGDVRAETQAREDQTRQLLLSLVSANPGLMGNEAIASQVGAAFRRQPGITDVLSNLKAYQEGEEGRLRGIAQEEQNAQIMRKHATELARLGVRLPEGATEQDALGLYEQAAGEAQKQELAQLAFERASAIADREDKQRHEIEKAQQGKGTSDFTRLLSAQGSFMNRLLDIVEKTQTEDEPAPGTGRVMDDLVSGVNQDFSNDVRDLYAIKHIVSQNQGVISNFFGTAPTIPGLIQQLRDDRVGFMEEWGKDYDQGLRAAAANADLIESTVANDPILGQFYGDIANWRDERLRDLYSQTFRPTPEPAPGQELIHESARRGLETALDPFALKAPRQEGAPLTDEEAGLYPPEAAEGPDAITAPAFQTPISPEIQTWIIGQPPEFQPALKLLAEEFAVAGDDAIMAQMQLFMDQLMGMAYADQLRGNQ